MILTKTNYKTIVGKIVHHPMEHNSAVYYKLTKIDAVKDEWVEYSGWTEVK